MDDDDRNEVIRVVMSASGVDGLKDLDDISTLISMKRKSIEKNMPAKSVLQKLF